MQKSQTGPSDSPRSPHEDDGRGAFHPVTLSFRDREMEAAFLVDYATRALSIVRMSLLFGAFLYTIYAVMDYQMVPRLAPQLLVLRIIAALFLILVVVFSTARNARRYLQLTMSLVILIAGTGVVAIVVMVEQTGWYTYYGGIILALVYAHALLRLRFIYATLTGAVLVTLYFVGSSVFAGTPAVVTMNNMFYLTSAYFLGMFSSYGLEYYSRLAFLRTRMLDRSRLDLSAEYERTSSELAAVREIQLAMLPKELLEHPEVDLAAMMNTAAEVGGDYYDYVLGEDGKITFAIGDATGHGARAGALVTASKMLFSTYAERDSPDKFLERASQILRRMKLPRLYMTLAVGKICGRDLVIAGAGMPPALLFRAESGTVERIALKGIPLGSPYDGAHPAQSVALSGGDTLVLMTDGLPELFDSRNCMMGYDRIEEVLKSVPCHTARETLDAIARRIEEWRGEEALRDDLTLVVMKVKTG